MAAEAGGIHIAFAPYVLGNVGSFPITATLVTSWVVVGLLVVWAFFFARSLKMTPGRGQVLVETTIGFAYDYVKEVLEDEKLARRYFPFIMTIFVFIAAANLFGLLPFTGHALTFHDTPLFYPVNTDLNMTLAMAVVAVLVIEFAGIAALGVLKYGSKFVNFHSVVGFCIGIIELISELARLITFSFRLFGNIFAGKVLILVALYFLPYFLPVPLLVYEVAVGIIQGAVFALLTLFFIKIAVTEPH
ncbi:F0F1 ATP synthase subunit A [Patescibacteria group bacterium]|nr:F0F1 ATP synthase subunit A [Patescibacteria group bacterium]